MKDNISPEKLERFGKFLNEVQKWRDTRGNRTGPSADWCRFKIFAHSGYVYAFAPRTREDDVPRAYSEPPKDIREIGDDDHSRPPNDKWGNKYLSNVMHLIDARDAAARRGVDVDIKHLYAIVQLHRKSAGIEYSEEHLEEDLIGKLWFTVALLLVVFFAVMLSVPGLNIAVVLPVMMFGGATGLAAIFLGWGIWCKKHYMHEKNRISEEIKDLEIKSGLKRPDSISADQLKESGKAFDRSSSVSEVDSALQDHPEVAEDESAAASPSKKIG